MRLLALASLVLAFAQPYIPIAGNPVTDNERAISIFVDNSFSMDALGVNGSLIEQAKTKAIEIAKAYKASDKFQLLTNDFEAKHQRLVNREEFLKMVDEIHASPAFRTVSEVLSRQAEALQHADVKKPVSYLLSDFQKTTVDLEKAKPDSSMAIRMLPFESQKISNVEIDSVWFTSPVRQINEKIQLIAKVRNMSGDAIENVAVKLMVNGKQKSPGGVNIPAHSETLDTLSFTLAEPGWQDAELSITDHPVTFDDNWYFSFFIAEKLPILCINQEKPSEYIDALFMKDSSIAFKNMNQSQIDYSAFPANHLIILNGLKNISTGLGEDLNKFVRKGGSLVVFPGIDAEINSYNKMFELLGTNNIDALHGGDVPRVVSNNETINTNGTGNSLKSINVNRINIESDVYKEVFDKVSQNMDLPAVYKYYTFTKNTKSGEEGLLILENNNSLLSQYPVGKGKVILCAVPLNTEFSNFPRHAIFVPTLFKIALLASETGKLSYIIGRDESIELQQGQTAGENVFHLIQEANHFDIIPEHRIVNDATVVSLHGQVVQAGNYHLKGDSKKLATYSFNYDRKESDLQCYTGKELEELAAKFRLNNTQIMDTSSPEISKKLLEMESGVHLWKYCIMLTLLFLAFEVLILRLFR